MSTTRKPASDPVKAETEVRKRTVMRLTFEDGSTVDADPGSVASLMKFEREVGRPFNLAMVSDVVHLGYMQCGKPNGDTTEDLDEWAEDIIDSELVEIDVPTKAPRKN